jgi:hypothetical protein
MKRLQKPRLPKKLANHGGTLLREEDRHGLNQVNRVHAAANPVQADHFPLCGDQIPPHALVEMILTDLEIMLTDLPRSKPMRSDRCLQLQSRSLWRKAPPKWLNPMI